MHLYFLSPHLPRFKNPVQAITLPVSLVKSIPTTTGKVDFFNILIPTLELFFVLPENELLKRVNALLELNAVTAQYRLARI